MYPRVTRPVLASIVLATLAACSTSPDSASQPAITAPTTSAPTTTSAATAPTGVAAGEASTPDSDYRDGDYEATGWYGSGPSSITVDLTLADDVITEVSVTPHATDPTSLDYQQRFADAVPDVVVGRRIDEVEIDRLAGSSGTPDGFNDALAQIRAQATPTEPTEQETPHDCDRHHPTSQLPPRRPRPRRHALPARRLR
jgi:uncharacterized protein with FMN-binding domain